MGLELREYILPLRRWWWLIVAATLVAAVSSYLMTRQQAPIYKTRATVMVGNPINNSNPNGYDFYQAAQLATTYTDIVQRDSIRQATMAALGLSYLPGYSARAVPNTQLIELTVTDTDPARAQAVANELLNQLARLSPAGMNGDNQQRQAFITGQLNALETKIIETQDEVTKKQAELANLFSARQIADVQNQIVALQNKLGMLQSNYAALLSNTPQGALNVLNVVEKAALPVAPIGSNTPATILLAAAIGFILAAGAAYLLEYLDDTMKNPEDVQKTLGLTTLGAVPMMNTESETGLAMLVDTQWPAAEAYRVLRTNLQFAAVERPLKTLLITSPAPSEGKSLTAANLAVALAQSGQRVVLADTDLHRPRLHRVFGLRNNVGVTTALIAETLDGLDEFLQDTGLPGLRLLTSGPLPPNPAELLGSARMRNLLADLHAQADVVVLDSPPVTVLSDAAVLAAQADGVLMVLDAGRTRREVARRALAALGSVHARVIGVLLNRMPIKGLGYYYYYGHDRNQAPGNRRNGSIPHSANGPGAGATQSRRGRRGSAEQTPADQHPALQPASEKEI